MEMLDVTRPGTNIVVSDGTGDESKAVFRAGELGWMIGGLEDLFAEALVALDLVTESLQEVMTHRPFNRIDYENLPDSAGPTGPGIAGMTEEELSAAWRDARSRFEQAVLDRERALLRDAPVVPRRIASARLSCSGKAFLFAVDGFIALGEKLRQEPDVPNEVGLAIKALRKALPTVGPLRNSASHLEDRIRGHAKAGRGRSAPMALQDNTLVLSAWSATTFSATVADGTVKSVDVTMDTVRLLQKALQRILDAFTWQGPGSIVPGPA